MTESGKIWRERPDLRKGARMTIFDNFFRPKRRDPVAEELDRISRFLEPWHYEIDIVVTQPDVIPWRRQTQFIGQVEALASSHGYQTTHEPDEESGGIKWHFSKPKNYDPEERAAEIMKRFKKTVIKETASGGIASIEMPYEPYDVEQILFGKRDDWLKANGFELVSSHDVYPCDIWCVRKKELHP